MSVEARKRAHRVVAAFEKFKNDPRMFDALMTASRDYAYRKLYHLETKAEGFGDVGTAATVDDWTQEVMLKLWKYRESFQGQSGAQYLCWLKQIVRNKTCDAANYLIEQKQTKVPPTLIDEAGKAYDNPEIYGSDANQREWRIRIPDTLKGVDYRICELLLGGKSLADVAYHLSMTSDAVRMRVKRMGENREVAAAFKRGVLV